MRHDRSDIIDNLIKKMDNKIQNKIDETLYLSGNLQDKHPSKWRNGMWNFGGIQLRNTKRRDYATFGVGGTGVGP